jgi:hypothetical protein
LGALKEFSIRIWFPIWREVVETVVVCIVTNMAESTFLEQVCASLEQIFIASRLKFCELNDYCVNLLASFEGNFLP